MHLYSLTVKPATAIVSSVFGSFSKAKEQEIVVNHGSSISLLRHDSSSEQLETVVHQDMFGCIRECAPFRLTGADTDYLIVGSDSGRINILKFDQEKQRFVKVHEETFGKSGCRRIVPGQFLAVDPNGRAAMIGAIEKQKFVYILTRDSAANLVISSPLEAHKSKTILMSTVGMDVGFENPLFCCLEIDYSVEVEEGAEPSKFITYYELDLGLNHVTRKQSIRTDPTAHRLVAVPGGGVDGPGGVLICGQTHLSYHNIEQPDRILRCPLPRRVRKTEATHVEDSSLHDSLIIVAHSTHRQKGFFFFLVQSEIGDLFKVQVLYDADSSVATAVTISYFDSVPVASSLNILQKGFLFVASEFGNHYLFQFRSLGDNDPNLVETSSNTPDQTVSFESRQLVNFVMVQEMESLAPIIDMHVADISSEGNAQFYCLSGRSERSALRVLRHGLSVVEMAASDVPGSPCAVWSVKTSVHEDTHKYIVVSYTNATLVLSIGEAVEEVSDSGFLTNVQTLHVGLLGDSTVAQVTPNGIRLISLSHSISDWSPPGKKIITQCAMNSMQLVIAMTGGELAYFEMDHNNSLNEIERKEIRNDVSALALAPIQAGRLRAKYLAVGCFDNTVLLLAVDDPSQPMLQLTIQASGELPVSLLLASLNSDENIQLFVGCQNGVLIRSAIDPSNNTLTDSNKRYLGSRPVRLFAVHCEGRPCVLALSSRSWLCYLQQNRIKLTPLAYEQMDFAASFSSEQCPEGMVAIAGTTLRIIAVEKLGEVFNSSAVQLERTPRRIILHPVHRSTAVIIECDHRAYDRKIIQSITQQTAMDLDKSKDRGEESDDESDDEEQRDFVTEEKASRNSWSSMIRLIDIFNGTTHSIVELGLNETVLSCAAVEFSDRPDEIYLAVGISRNLVLTPRSHSQSFISLYRFAKDGKFLEIVHQTPVDQPVMALCAYSGRLLAGCGTMLRLYDIGQQKLLRKVELRSFPTNIIRIYTNQDRIYVADLAESIHLVKFRRAEKQFEIFADCTEPRYMTDMTVLDYNTVAGVDKFGNLFVTRLPAELHSVVEGDTSSVDQIANLTSVKGAPYKMKTSVNYHIGDMATCLTKTSLVPGAQEALFFGTVSGAIGSVVPFTSKEDVDLFSHLEMHMRVHDTPLAGRDHLAYRSAYWPVKDCIDGDLCEQYSTLPLMIQDQIAQEMGFTSVELNKKIDDLRNRFL